VEFNGSAARAIRIVEFLCFYHFYNVTSEVAMATEDLESLLADDEQDIEALSHSQRPFSERLEKFLVAALAQHEDRATWRRSIFSKMVRKADVPLVLELSKTVGTSTDAFLAFWTSGLFDEAQSLLDGEEEVQRAAWPHLPKRYKDDLGAQFEVAREAAKWNLWGSVAADCFEVLRGAAASSRGLQGLSLIRMVGPPGAEKAAFARAMHEDAGRNQFCSIFTTELEEDPTSSIETCCYGGTVYIDQTERFPPKWLGSLVKNAEGSRSLILLTDEAEIHPMDQSFWVNHLGGTTTIMQVPSLQDRFADIPVMVNQLLLTIGPSALGEVRDTLAERIMLRCRAQDQPKSCDWLRKAVYSLVRALSPNTPVEDQHESQVSRPEKDSKFEFWDDYRIVWHQGTEHKLSATQAEIVEYLHDRYQKRRPAVKERQMITHLSNNSDRIRFSTRVSSVFRSEDPRTVLIRKLPEGFLELNV
jgi:hypothetical protein